MPEPSPKPINTAAADSQEQFVALMNQHQSRLSAFIESLVPDYQAALDLLQDTNLVLWRKREQFQPGSNFWAWASTVAYQEVLHHRRSFSRSKVVFSDKLVEQLADVSRERLETHDDRCRLLRLCLQELPERQRTTVERRYSEAASVGAIAAEQQTSVNAISKQLQRARLALLHCIERKLAEEEPS